MSSNEVERWRRIKDLFGRAADLPESERSAWLRQACGEDADLCEEVESLLRESESEDAPVPPPVIPGYEIGPELGRGIGMVYAAKETALQRQVAIKCLRRDVLTTAEQLARFRNEPRAAARLDHPNIVRVYASGETGAVAWFAMELVPGHDLRTEIERQRATGAAASLALLPRRGSPDYVHAVLRIVRDVAMALHHAHEAGIVHRDVKPHNIMLRSADRRALVADFGIAKDSRMGAITRTGHAPGTVFYMSPEQVAVWQKTVDRRTDVYSLGVVMYELLTLRRPFDGATDEQVLAAIVAARPQSLRAVDPSLSRDLELVCNKAMEKDLAERYATAQQFAQDLDCLLILGSPVHARPAAMLQRVRRGIGRWRRSFGVVAGLMLAAIASFWLAKAQAEAGEREQLQARLEPWAAGRLAALDASARTEFAAALFAAESAPELSTAAVALRSRMRAEVSDFRVARLAYATALLAGGDERSPYDPTVSHDLLSAQAAVAAVLQLLPADPEARTLAAELEARITGTVSIAVRLGDRQASGRVGVREIVPATGAIGARTELGLLPVDSLRLRPAFYRFEVDLDDQSRLELSRMILPGSQERIDLVRKPVVDTVGMVRIGGGTLAMPEDDRDPCNHGGLSIEVAPFLLDAGEVSVGEYAEFLAATGHATPPADAWRAMLLDPANRERPVVLVSFRDAQAYAEWQGKRLPTHAEWEWAARGPRLRRFPWSEAGDGDYLGATRGRASGSKLPQRLADWQTWTMPVRTGDDRTEDSGIFHLLGNVSEWTESIQVQMVAESSLDPRRRVPNPWLRWVAGSSWQAEHRGETLAAHEMAGVTNADASWTCGFRCARSLP